MNFQFVIEAGPGERFHQNAFVDVVGRTLILNVGRKTMPCVIKGARVEAAGSRGVITIDPEAPIELSLLVDDSPSETPAYRRREDL